MSESKKNHDFSEIGETHLLLADEIEEGIAQQINRDGSGDQRENGAVKENSGGRLVEPIRKEIVGPGGKEHADE